ncbi:MAG: hypothetical protein IKN50_03245, partial [Clostridia bacterium]|nr:hypothetical protein [Clostridia bacterium]
MDILDQSAQLIEHLLRIRGRERKAKTQRGVSDQACRSPPQRDTASDKVSRKDRQPKTLQKNDKRIKQKSADG